MDLLPFGDSGVVGHYFISITAIGFARLATEQGR